MSKIDRIEDYLHFKRVNNFHTSDNTTRSYRIHLMQWHEFAQERFETSYPNHRNDERFCDPSVLKTIAEQYRDHITKHRDSVQCKTILYILSDYCELLGVDPNPFEVLRRQYKVNQKEVNSKKIRRDDLVLTEIEVETMIGQAKRVTMLKKSNTTGFYLAHRNLIMVKMLANFGMRIEALINIDIRDIDYRKRKIIIQYSKNKMPYPIPIMPMINDIKHYVEVIRKDYLKLIKAKPMQTYSMFLTRTGSQLSDTSARRAINDIAKMAGFYEPQRSTHQLRHYRATQYLKEGLQPDIISQIMGVSVEVLRQNYFHMTHDDTVREYENWLNKVELVPVCPNCGYDQRKQAMTKKGQVLRSIK